MKKNMKKSIVILLSLVMSLVMITSVLAYQVGDSGEEVANIQSALIAQGYLDGEADGEYGPMTESAVSAFRVANGLPAEGGADEEMVALLFGDTVSTAETPAESENEIREKYAEIAETYINGIITEDEFMNWLDAKGFSETFAVTGVAVGALTSENRSIEVDMENLPDGITVDDVTQLEDEKNYVTVDSLIDKAEISLDESKDDYIEAFRAEYKIVDANKLIAAANDENIDMNKAIAEYLVSFIDGVNGQTMDISAEDASTNFEYSDADIDAITLCMIVEGAFIDSKDTYILSDAQLAILKSEGVISGIENYSIELGTDVSLFNIVAANKNIVKDIVINDSHIDYDKEGEYKAFYSIIFDMDAVKAYEESREINFGFPTDAKRFVAKTKVQIGIHVNEENVTDKVIINEENKEFISEENRNNIDEYSASAFEIRESAEEEYNRSEEHVHNYTCKVTTPATTASDGVRTYLCSCGDSFTDIIPMLSDGHEHKYISAVTVTAICGAPGTKTYTCECGDKYTSVIPSTGNHSWGYGVVTKVPTVDETGIRTYTCIFCGKTILEDIPCVSNGEEDYEQSTNEHQHKFSAATCTEPAKCSCGETTGSALGHNFGNNSQVCLGCGVTNPNYIEPETEHQHNYSNATCTKASTCTICGATDGYALGHDFGSNNISCSRCGAMNPNYQEPTVGHQHSYSSATCTSPAMCSCGATYGYALGHDFGSNNRTCSRCGTANPNYQEPTTAHQHSYSSATCTSPATCSCGVTNGSALGHDFGSNNKTCSRCGTANPNYQEPTTEHVHTTYVVSEDVVDDSRCTVNVYCQGCGWCTGDYPIANWYEADMVLMEHEFQCELKQ